MLLWRCSLLLAGVWVSTGGVARADLRQPVRVATGLVQGVPEGADGVLAFRGLPYAAPPTGDRRWREPQPALAWEGVRLADTFGPQCPQPPGNSGALPWSLRRPRQAPPPTYSEDCLYLNVWTPARAASDALPVLVYLSPGSASGARLARRGLLVVTVNHRVGLLGGLGHPELTRESPRRGSGNYGLLDQLAALEWVHANIAAFGGDPAKVTLAGYSVGSTTVHHLTSSPVAKGLFRAAICMSFPYDYLLSPHKVGGVWQKQEEGLKFAAAKHLQTVDELRRLPPEALFAPDPAVGGFTRAVLGSAFCLDGWSLPREYPQALGQGLASDVPTLTGFTVDDFGPPAQYSQWTTAANFVDRLPATFGELKTAFLARREAYLPLLPGFPPQTTADARALEKLAQVEYRQATVDAWATRRARTARTPVYTYVFEQAMPCREHPEFGAFHTSDLTYEFDNLDTLDHPWTADDRRVAEQVSSYWANFVKTGDPNGGPLPRWAAFDPAAPTTMALGERMGPRAPAEPARRAFYRDLLATLESGSRR